MMEIQYISVDALIPYERNAKKHPDEQVERIANSIRQFGFKQPIVVDRDNVVVIGHGRLLAAKKLSMETVPCIMADDLTEEQIRALRLADHKDNSGGCVSYRTMEREAAACRAIEKNGEQI